MYQKHTNLGNSKMMIHGYFGLFQLPEAPIVSKDNKGFLQPDFVFCKGKGGLLSCKSGMPIVLKSYGRIYWY